MMARTWVQIAIDHNVDVVDADDQMAFMSMEIRELLEENESLKARVSEMEQSKFMTSIPHVFEELVNSLNDLIDSSHGVAGLHLNGDVAPWDELLSGGRFEEWLMSLDDARTLLAAITKPSENGDQK